MEALINEYRLEIIEHCWKYSNSHSINWILKFRKFLILAPAPSIFSGVSRKGRKVCHSFKCFKIGVLHHIRSWSTFSNFLIQIFGQFWQSPQILKIWDDGGLNVWILSWNHKTLLKIFHQSLYQLDFKIWKISIFGARPPQFLVAFPVKVERCVIALNASK